MKKVYTAAFLAISALSVSAQSAIDAYNLFPDDLRGTARFMSMAGAFGALGGDLSTLSQNPAGLGVYRSSEVGVTIDLDFQSSKTMGSFTDSHTGFYCNNFGYVGSLYTGSDVMPTFSWGAAYQRKASFDRDFHGRFQSLPTSVSNYIASFTNGTDPSYLLVDNVQNPYQGISTPSGMIYPDWLSILAYNAYMINPQGSSNNYSGLYDSSYGTTANSEFSVRERGYIDEYTINFGGNFVDKVYWGIGFGITDLKWTQQAFYDEELQNARVPDYYATGTERGDGYFALDNFKQITGSGFNIKAGLIVKPIDELRIGAAVHTPTWYSLNQGYDAGVDFSYSTGYDNGYDSTDWAYFGYKLRSPWRVILSAAGVIGGRFILSADYQREFYDAMHYSDSYGFDYSYENQDIKDYFQGSNTVRIGAEYRVTPAFSVRAGTSFTTTAVKDQASNQQIEIATSGTNPAYTFTSDTNYITFGLGYRFGGFYIDGAYVHRSRESRYHPFTSFESMATSISEIPTAKVSQNNNNVVLTLGYKF